MYAQLFGGAISFQQYATHIPNFPFFSGAASVPTLGKNFLHRFDEWRAGIRVNGKVLPVNDENQLQVVTFITLAIRFRHYDSLPS